MVLGDSEPGSQVRMAKLREMVVGGALTIDELRFLKQLLRDVTLQTDIISRIPLELVAIVVQSLGLRDLWACYAVSKLWRFRLMAIPVASVLAGIHFPALGDSSRERIPGPDVGTRFWETLGKSLRRIEAPARSKLAQNFCWQDETLFTIDDPTVYQRIRLERRSSDMVPLSSHGRIAWMPERFTVCIDSLVTLRRKIFSYPEGKLLGLAHEMSLVGLGSKLVVATMGRRMMSWDLETGQREHASLPVLIHHCSVEGDLVVFTGNSQVFIYRHGGALLELAISSMPEHHRPIPHLRIITDAVIHPGNDNTIFVTATETNTPRYVVVHEFTNRKWTMSYEHRVHGQPKPRNYLQKANSHGLYAVSHSLIHSLRDVPAETCHPSREIFDGQLLTCATYFNAYHRTFSRQYFQTPAPNFCSRFWAWNDCVATSYWHGPYAVVTHQSSLEYRARKPQWEKYEVKDGVGEDGGRPEVLTVDDSFFVVANSCGFMAWGF